MRLRNVENIISSRGNAKGEREREREEGKEEREREREDRELRKNRKSQFY